MPEKDLLLKGVCCLMLLQINGEAKGETQVRSYQKQRTHLEKGFPMGGVVQSFPKEALPVKSEVKPQWDDVVVKKQQNFVSVEPYKKGRKVEGVRFFPKKMNLPYVPKRSISKSAGKFVPFASNEKSTSFQWTRIPTQRGGKPLLNRSVANRLCNER